ncbi:hypothetical protein [Catenovulum sediminis]|uniref:Uncharacterized protein n=1 Tax=Catenovulum sediminis TaxID=1740262 RepID=A0ABV1RKF6_9ALTE|nr:hypothetical protein [Catenovulum sediminis]
MITLTTILAGEIARTKRTFNVDGIGELELTKLPVAQQKLAAQAMAKKPKTDKEAEEVEKVILNSVYQMLSGETNEQEAEKLLDSLDEVQISRIFSTGYYWADLTVKNLEQTEKNSQSSPKSEP